MKKLLIFIAILCLNCAQNSALAQHAEQNLCKMPPYEVGNGFSNGLSKITGTNFLLTKVVEHEVQKSLKKALGSNFNVEIKVYGGKSFIDGKFKSMDITSKQVITEGVYLSNFKASTLCEFNHVAPDKSNLYFIENYVMNFSAQITDADLKKTVLSAEYLNKVNSINLGGNSFLLFKVFDPNVEIVNSRVIMSLRILAPLLSIKEPLKISANSSLMVENGKILFTDIRLQPTNSRINLNAINPILNILNPFIFNIKMSKNTTGTVTIKHVIIKDGKIHIDGVMFAPKNYVKAAK